MDIKKFKSVRWIDANRPSAKDLDFLEKEFELHPIIVGELKGPSARARVESYKDYLYLIYYLPYYDPRDGASVRSEIDFIITKNTVVTVHYQPLDEAFKDFKMDSSKNSLELTHNLIEHLITFQERQLRHIREKVEAVSKEIFKGKEGKILESITHLKRDISEYRISVRMQEPILKSLFTKGVGLWGIEAEVYLNDLIGEQMKIVAQVQDYREAITDFESTNNQLMNMKINNAMKTFTTLSFLTFPFVLVAGLFSMRIMDVPLENTPHAFWIVLGAMLACMLGLIAYFKKKGLF